MTPLSSASASVSPAADRAAVIKSAMADSAVQDLVFSYLRLPDRRLRAAALAVVRGLGSADE